MFRHQEHTLPFPLNHGNYQLRSLFYETGCNKDFDFPPVYTLKLRDHDIPTDSVVYNPEGCNRCRSIYLEYVDIADPSEYKFAMRVFGSWEHWRQLRECDFFQPTYKLMKEALKVKLESEVVELAKQTIKAGVGPQSLQAAKWLYDQIRPHTKRGRPSKAEVDGELKRQSSEAKELKEDLERLNLNVS